MSIRKKRICIIVTIFLIIALWVVIPLIMNPLRRSTGWIRKDLLQQMPIGIDMEDVIRIIEDNEAWTLVVQRNFGLLLCSDGRTPIRSLNPERFPDSPSIGEQSIRVYLGTYITFTRVAVEAYFAFDGEGYLLDIFIRKDLDVI